MRRYQGLWFNLGASGIEVVDMEWVYSESDNARARKRHLPHNHYFCRYLKIKMAERGPVVRFEHSVEILEDWRW